MPILPAETFLFPDDLLSSDATDMRPDRQWWVLHTRARQEKSLARQLLESEIPFYLPLTSRVNLVRGRRTRSRIPLFGGYLFLWANADERVRCLRTGRVVHVLDAHDQRQLTDELRNLHHLIGANAPVTLEQRLSAGQRVRVKSGAMQGVEGTVICRRGRMRLLVAITFLQQGVSVEIDDWQVEAL